MQGFAVCLVVKLSEIYVFVVRCGNQSSVLGVATIEVPGVVVNEPVGVQQGLVLNEANPINLQLILHQPVKCIHLVLVALLVGDDDDLAAFPELIDGLPYLWKRRGTSEQPIAILLEKPLGRTNPGLFLNPRERQINVELLDVVPADVVVKLLVVKGHHVVK